MFNDPAPESSGAGYIYRANIIAGLIIFYCTAKNRSRKPPNIFGKIYVKAVRFSTIKH